jgi:uncharacterized ferritin-like protein (DUF455 family)
MHAAKAIGTKVVNGVTVRDDPAREPCFEIVHLHDDVPDNGIFDLDSRRGRIHGDVNQEVQTLEIAALCLADFPNAPWELRLELARQCWDEARHTAMNYRRLREMGGRKGQYPIVNLDWCCVAMINSLAGRLAVQHRTFEAGSLDVGGQSVPMFDAVGDHETAEMIDAIEADEIPHVRFANVWIKRLTEADPRAVLEVASAMAWLKKVLAGTGGESRHPVLTNVESREAAGFTSAEVSAVERLEEHLVGPRAERTPALQLQRARELMGLQDGGDG